MEYACVHFYLYEIYTVHLCSRAAGELDAENFHSVECNVQRVWIALDIKGIRPNKQTAVIADASADVPRRCSSALDIARAHSLHTAT